MGKRKNYTFEYIKKKIRRLEDKLMEAQQCGETQSSTTKTTSSIATEHRSTDDDYEELYYDDEPLDKETSQKPESPKAPEDKVPEEKITEDNPGDKAPEYQTFEDKALEDKAHGPNSPEAPKTDNIQKEPDLKLDDDILEILGEDPSATPVYGKEINKDLASRLQYILVNGLTKDIKKELTTKYLIPANCQTMAAPELNIEIKAALTEPNLKRDKGIEYRQKQMASAIACLSEITSLQLQAKDKNNKLLKSLIDTLKILCDLQHEDSIKRRYFATSSLKKNITEQLIPTKIDKYLFGCNLAETLKTAKAVSKSSAEIKIDNNKNIQRQIRVQQQPPNTKNLNWKPRGIARRQPAPQSNKQPASARARPETSSRPSQRPPPPPKYNAIAN